jgi:hypothetical protein
MSTCLIELIKPYIEAVSIEEIAGHLNISSSDILDCEFWPFVLWCRVSGRGAVLVSPRKMSFWLPAIEKAIAHCRDFHSLEQLKNALEIEFKTKYDQKTQAKIYSQALQAELRQLVEQRWRQIEAETAARRKAESLSHSYQSIIQQCLDQESLHVVAQLIRKNYSIFQPFPEMLPYLRQVWVHHREILTSNQS